MSEARVPGRRAAHALLCTLLLVTTVVGGIGIAAEPVRSVATSTPALKPVRPYWIELEAPQRAVLEPLADDWERLDGQTKKKWVEIARRYPRMSADEQQRTQQRMREWAMLTPEQRRVARDSFARVRAMSPEQRAGLLQRYRELPDAQKTELAKEGRASKTLTLPKAEVTPSQRRVQIREGAKAENPAVVRKAVEARSAPPPGSIPGSLPGQA